MEKILIFRIGHIGDMAISVPALWAIREQFPDAELTLLTNQDQQNKDYIVADALLPENGLIDQWLFYPSNERPVSRFTGLLKLMYELRRGHFDALFYLMPRDRTVGQIRRDEIFFRISGITKIIGSEILKQNVVGTVPVAKPLPKIESEGDFLMHSLEKEGIRPESEINQGLLISAEEKEFAAGWLEKNCAGAFGSKTLIAIAPSAKWKSKIWEEERFAEVVARLIKTFDVFPVVFGAEVDRATSERLIRTWGRGANAAGELNVRKAAAAIEYCGLYLGHDTGTMHLASAVGVPCVALFSAIDYPGRWYPAGNDNIVLRSNVECEGCFLSECPFENRCMNLISTSQVFDACKISLERAINNTL